LNENYPINAETQKKVYEAIERLDPNTRKNLYDTGEIPFMSVASDMVASYKDNKFFHEYESGRMGFIAISQKATSEKAAKITQNRNFLMALSYAIDRTAFVKALFPTEKPSTIVINPGISVPNGGKWRDYFTNDEKYHPLTANEPKAKEYLAALLKETGYKSVDELPVFDYLCQNNELNKTVGEYLQDTWNRVLGIKINIRPMDGAQYWENLYNAPYDIAMTGWGPDYDDPFTYLDMWDSRGGWNKTGWEGKAYYEKLMEANRQADMAKRNALFYEAETILLTEAPIIPLRMATGTYVLNTDKINNVTVNAFGPMFDFRYSTLN
jgi:oligopeptide transport system substrate-binding protein